MDYVDVGKMIRLLREKQKMTQDKLAEGITTRKTLGIMERKPH